ncbi:MAG: TRAP transporter TatT component family protein [Spirochaetota bacterium]
MNITARIFSVRIFTDTMIAAIGAVALLSLASCTSGPAVVQLGSLEVMYANAYVQGPAERLPPKDFDRKQRELKDARSHYLASAKSLGAELERRFPGIAAALKAGEAQPFLATAGNADVGLLYWTSAAIMSAYALDPLDVELSMRIREVKVLMARAYALDPDFGQGSLDEFYISFYGSLPASFGGDKELAKHHFEEALRKSGDGSVSAYTAYAMAVFVPAQDYREWKVLMQKALAVDLSKFPDRRLANDVARTKALWLYGRKDDLFLETEEE